MAERLDFESWWADFLEQIRRVDRVEGEYAPARLVQSIRELPSDLRSVFLDRLLQVALAGGRDAGLALLALESEAEPRQCDVIAGHVARLLAASTGCAGEEAIAPLLRVLAARQANHYLPLVSRYLHEREICALWTSVAWGLWPAHPAEFAAAWARYFTSVPAVVWRGTAVVQAFVSRPAALEAVRRGVEERSAGAWADLRSALLEESRRPWVSPADRAALEALAAPAG